MGQGIAHAFAVSGRTITLHDIDPSAAERAREAIEALLQGGVERGELSQDEARAAHERLRVETDLARAARGADLVVEAAPEDLELKRELFAELDRRTPEAAILATNTSSLPVAEIAAATGRPGRVVGLHFFNPVHRMRLVEIVLHDCVDLAVRERAVEVVRSLGKEPITVADSPGFATSRLGLALGLEAIRMVEEGVASVRDIDLAMELGYNHPMGPLALTDWVGLDVRLAIAEHLAETLDEGRFRPPEILRELVATGRLGRKSGRGFYHWADGKRAEPAVEVERRPA